MRLLSFLTAIERTLAAEASTGETRDWESNRIVNFHRGLARLILAPRAGNPGGSIFVQSFAIANGSLCLKATLAWQGSDSQQVISVFSTPELNWTNEATRIAATWLQGPPAQLHNTRSVPMGSMAAMPLAATA